VGIQVLVVFAGLGIALSVGALAGLLELDAPLVGWLAIGLAAVMWTLLALTERVIGRDIWHYTAPYPYRGMQGTADAAASHLESAPERELADEEDIRLAA
jgi:hypothetical protein